MHYLVYSGVLLLGLACNPGAPVKNEKSTMKSAKVLAKASKNRRGLNLANINYSDVTPEYLSTLKSSKAWSCVDQPAPPAVPHCEYVATPSEESDGTVEPPEICQLLNGTGFKAVIESDGKCRIKILVDSGPDGNDEEPLLVTVTPVGKLSPSSEPNGSDFGSSGLVVQDESGFEGFGFQGGLTWRACANEGETCQSTGSPWIAYGGRDLDKMLVRINAEKLDSFLCNSATFTPEYENFFQNTEPHRCFVLDEISRKLAPQARFVRCTGEYDQAEVCRPKQLSMPPSIILYGLRGKNTFLGTLSGSATEMLCRNSYGGDPLPGVPKECVVVQFAQGGVTPPPISTTTTEEYLYCPNIDELRKFKVNEENVIHNGKWIRKSSSVADQDLASLLESNAAPDVKGGVKWGSFQIRNGKLSCVLIGPKEVTATTNPFVSFQGSLIDSTGVVKIESQYYNSSRGTTDLKEHFLREDIIHMFTGTPSSIRMIFKKSGTPPIVTSTVSGFGFQGGLGWRECALEGQTCQTTSTGSPWIAYGVARNLDKMLVRINAENLGSFLCNSATFTPEHENFFQTSEQRRCYILDDESRKLARQVSFVRCTGEYEQPEVCRTKQPSIILYGSRGKTTFLGTLSGAKEMLCRNSYGGDPLPGVPKECVIVQLPQRGVMPPPISTITTEDLYCPNIDVLRKFKFDGENVIGNAKWIVDMSQFKPGQDYGSLVEANAATDVKGGVKWAGYTIGYGQLGCKLSGPGGEPIIFQGSLVDQKSWDFYEYDYHHDGIVERQRYSPKDNEILKFPGMPAMVLLFFSMGSTPEETPQPTPPPATGNMREFYGTTDAAYGMKWEECASEGGTCTNPGPWLLYGAGEHFLVKLINAEPAQPEAFPCTNGAFKLDPYPGYPKKCYRLHEAARSLAAGFKTNLSRLVCSQENEACNNIKPGIILYGKRDAGDIFILAGGTLQDDRFVGTASFSCENSFSGDPLPNIFKECYMLRDAQHLK